MAFWKKPSCLFGAAYYTAVSLAIIFLASPLFRVLGFEYSGFIALFASIHLLYFAANESVAKRDEGLWSILKNLWPTVLIFSTIPLFASFISALFIPNCSLWDGFLFYIEIVFPTSIIATLCGVRFGIIQQSKTKTRIYLAIFWIGTMLFSLLPGYFSAKIYTYGWQYGYFPGLVWDEAMELHSGYWISRVIELAAISSWVIYQGRILQERGKRPAEIRKVFSLWEYWIMTIAITVFGVFYFLQYSDNDLNRHLNQQTLASEKIHLHYAPGSLTKDEITLYCYQAKEYVRQIDSVYGIREQNRIDIYAFSNSDDLYNYIGTREASITKPWKRSIYIAKQNLHSLKHELAHAILAEYGSLPFDMSWSTGLTEGAAVAIEDDYDGIHSADVLSARILQMNISSGVKDVMQFSGFLSSAPSTSYVLSGSFSGYLLKNFGGEKFLHVYKDRDFDDSYSKSLANLETDWKENLKKFETPMDHYDSLRTLYYFKRTSILRQPCIRRIGKLLKNADESFRSKNYKLADSLYKIVINESGRLRAIRGRVLSQLHLNNPQAALAILDTTASAQESQNLPALRLLRGDVIALAAGDLKKASVEWEEAMKLELGDGYFTSAFMRLYFFGTTNNISAVQKILRDLYGLEDIKDKFSMIFAVDSIPSEQNSAFYKARLYLYTQYNERSGMLLSAYKVWKEGNKKIEDYFQSKEMVKKSPGEELFDKLMEKKYAYFEAAFKDQSSESKTLP